MIIYAAGGFKNKLGKCYVSKWDGTKWQELGQDSNALNANSAINTICFDPYGNMYAAGKFTDTNQNYYVSKWNGTNWMRLGTYYDGWTGADYIQSICSDSKGNIYAGGQFKNAKNEWCVVKWDGTSWSELRGLYANKSIHIVCADSEDNIYAAGYFKNNLGYMYVAKWDGGQWEDFDNSYLSFKVTFGLISAIHIDKKGIMYVGGEFRSSPKGDYYVAKHDIKLNIKNNNSLENNFEIFPNPVTDILTIKTQINERTSVTIYDMSGQTIRNEFIDFGKYNILDIADLNTGLYTICFKSATKFQIRKLIKE